MRATSFVETRRAELDRTGETVIRASAVKLLLFLPIATGFAVFGLFLMAAPFVADEPGMSMTTAFDSSASVLIGLVSVLFFGVIGIPALILQMIQRRRLVIDRREMRVERRRSGQWETLERYAWADIESVYGARVGGNWSYRGQLLITVVLTPGAYAKSIEAHPMWKSGLQALNERIVGSRTHSLPSVFGWRTQPLLELITAVHAEKV
jgi:hypothetical protein